jgi:hypothetical protein
MLDGDVLEDEQAHGGLLLKHFKFDRSHDPTAFRQTAFNYHAGSRSRRGGLQHPLQSGNSDLNGSIQT